MVIFLTIKQLKRRVIQGLVEPELFYIPWEKKEEQNCFIRFLMHNVYDLANNIWDESISSSANVSFVIINSSGNIVYNTKQYNTTSIRINLPIGKYKIKFIASKNCKISNNWQEFIVKKSSEGKQLNISFYLQCQDFYKVKVRINEDELIPAIVLENKYENKRKSKIINAYGKGVIYNDYYNYFTNENVFSSCGYYSTRFNPSISRNDIPWRYACTYTYVDDNYNNSINTDAILIGCAYNQLYLKIEYKNATNKSIQVSEITENRCDPITYHSIAAVSKGLANPIERINADGSIERSSIVMQFKYSINNRYQTNSKIHVKSTWDYDEENYIDEVTGFGIGTDFFITPYKVNPLHYYLKQAYESDFDNQEYNGYYSAIYLPYDEQGNCKTQNSFVVNSLSDFEQLKQKYGTDYDASRLYINKNIEIPEKIIYSKEFDKVKRYGKSNDFISGSYTKLKLEDGTYYDFATGYSNTVLKDEITGEEYYYDNTVFPQYSDDYEYWINQS